MDIAIQPEMESDYDEVENLTREAFWDVYKPGCDEHLVLHKLRKSASFIPELDLVAWAQNRIVGNIVYSRAKVAGENSEHEVVCFGPISVHPSFQNKGIGSALIQHTVEIARNMGYKAIVIFGNPKYYGRFGFVNAEKYRITTAEGQNFDAFMALELYPGSLKGITGRFFEDGAFQSGSEELEQFEKNFPPKEKHITPTQL